MLPRIASGVLSATNSCYYAKDWRVCPWWCPATHQAGSAAALDAAFSREETPVVELRAEADG